MEKELIKKRFSKAFESYRANGAAQLHFATKLVTLLAGMASEKSFENVLEIGCGCGILTREFLKEFTPKNLYLNDLCSQICKPDVKEYMAPKSVTMLHYLIGDAEEMVLPAGQDIIISSAALQWLNDPLNFINNASSLLKEGALFAFTLFGPENLHEIATIANVSLDYCRFSKIINEVEKNYKVLVAEQELFKLEFGSAREVLYYLKATGVNGVEARSWSRSALEEFYEKYNSMFSLPNGNGITLTYQPYYFIIKKRGEYEE